ncbi:MAG: hypothetical protein AB7T74_01625 [Clostridia bacterium]
MTESLESAGKHLVEICSADLAVYKRAVKTLDSQAVRRLVESIIAQKTDQLGDLKAVAGNPEVNTATGTAAESISDAGTADETWPDIESLLQEITTREQALALATSTLAAETGSEEHRSTLNACAERSRKFASWTQDHLDLLSLF